MLIKFSQKVFETFIDIGPLRSFTNSFHLHFEKFSYLISGCLKYVVGSLEVMTKLRENE